ncbi:sensor histidine kinase [Flavobacterium cerinum]|uniref:histidine kinase n=1 Tax=Flavobacterium cerinum TaxID=2502784 RepID=A0A3S3QDC7_9FLAO|nr:PAS domain S-box protein [Flavobacterium cerinum]RWX00572.1 PAS domain S-box protein [Flavobacterium cerinum]
MINSTNSLLPQGEQLYKKMIEEVQDYAILLLDLDGNVQNWNIGAEKIKGYKEADILGKNFSLFYLPEDRASKLPKTLINSATLNGRATHEGWRVRNDGSTFWGSVVITALHSDDGDVIGFTKVTRDLTERKLAEEEKARDTRSIELQNRQLEEFAYITSHDLQEPIRKIQTFINLAKKNTDDKELLNNYLDKMSISADKMVSLIKDILNFSRLSSDKNQFISVNLVDILTEVIGELDLLIEEKKAIITVSSLPVIDAIPIQMNQLFNNLIHNAIKFNNGYPSIVIQHEIVKNDTGQYHLITISDNGIGFDQQYAEIAFKPFKRLTTNHSGTGIGLALCKRIVENHNGTISVASVLGEGTIFTILFPA